ncbi:MAG TPA: hypothetical protein VND93_25500 [Myxococcales bacterium]|nr:hypothetical protein [Myxococcales bacterium]
MRVVPKRGLFGIVTGVEIRCGKGATLEDVLFHIPTLQTYRRLEGVGGAARRLGDAVRGMLSRGMRIPSGSKAEEAWEEVRKLPAIIEARKQRLADEGLDFRTRIRLELEVEQLEKQLAGYARQLADFSKGRGYVAARIDDEEIEAEIAKKKVGDSDVPMLKEIRKLVGRDEPGERELLVAGPGGAGADFAFRSKNNLLMVVEQKGDKLWEKTEGNAPAKQLGQRLVGQQGMQMEGQTSVGNYLLATQWGDPLHDRIKLVSTSIETVDPLKAPLKDVKMLAVAVDPDTGQIIKTWPVNAEIVRETMKAEDKVVFRESLNDPKRRPLVEADFEAAQTEVTGARVFLVPATGTLPKEAELVGLGAIPPAENPKSTKKKGR